MFELGEISEFGYIMELLVRGKVSVGVCGVVVGVFIFGFIWFGVVCVLVFFSV